MATIFNRGFVQRSLPALLALVLGFLVAPQPAVPSAIAPAGTIAAANLDATPQSTAAAPAGHSTPSALLAGRVRRTGRPERRLHRADPRRPAHPARPARRRPRRLASASALPRVTTRDGAAVPTATIEPFRTGQTPAPAGRWAIQLAGDSKPLASAAVPTRDVYSRPFPGTAHSSRPPAARPELRRCVTYERTEIPMNPVAEMLLNEPAPAAIWATLMLLCLPALILLSSPQGLRHPRLTLLQTLGVLRRGGDARRRLRAEAVETIRYADEMRVAANQARLAAQRWQERHQQAEEQAAEAWQTWQEADSDLTRLRAAAAFGNPWTAPTPAEYADRERYLHRAVRPPPTGATCPRTRPAGPGWDARLHPFDQDVAVARAIVAHRRECYRRAAATRRPPPTTPTWPPAPATACTRST